MALVADCLKDDGWPVELTDDASIVVQIPVDQEDAYDASNSACRDKYPLDAQYMEPWGAREYGIQYDHWVDATIPCIEEFGYDPGDLPARETFIADMVADQPEYFLNKVVDPQIREDVRSGRWESVASFWDETCSYDPPVDDLSGTS